jgi:hypothetical protein
MPLWWTGSRLWKLRPRSQLGICMCKWRFQAVIYNFLEGRVSRKYVLIYHHVGWCPRQLCHLVEIACSVHLIKWAVMHGNMYATVVTKSQRGLRPAKVTSKLSVETTACFVDVEISWELLWGNDFMIHTYLNIVFTQTYWLQFNWANLDYVF